MWALDRLLATSRHICSQNREDEEGNAEWLRVCEILSAVKSNQRRFSRRCKTTRLKNDKGLKGASGGESEAGTVGVGYSTTNAIQCTLYFRLAGGYKS
jgi:hypothetical protein